MATIQRSTTKVANRLISYAEKRAEVSSGVNCPAEYAKAQFNSTRELWGKNNGIQAHHVIQSFKPDEITAESANQLGQELTKKIADGHEAVVYTHTDRDHIHNHIVINSVNFENGYKYHAHGTKELLKIREASDQICKENGLSVIKPDPDKSVHLSNAQYRTAEKGINRQARLINSINQSRKIATSKESYINEMNRLGYDVQWSDKRQRITYIDREYQRLNDERKLAGEKGVKFRFSERGLMRYGLSKHELSKEGLENDFRENAREKQATGARELGFNEHVFRNSRTHETNRGENERFSNRTIQRDKEIHPIGNRTGKGSEIKREGHQKAKQLHSQHGRTASELTQGSHQKSERTIGKNDKGIETTIGPIEQRPSARSPENEGTSSRPSGVRNQHETGKQTYDKGNTHGERITDRGDCSPDFGSVGDSDTSRVDGGDLFSNIINNAQQNENNHDHDLEQRRTRAKKKSKKHTLEDELELE